MDRGLHRSPVIAVDTGRVDLREDERLRELVEEVTARFR